MRGVLRVAAGPPESASWAVPVHRLLRGSVVGAGDCVAGRGFAEPAGFPGPGRDRGAAEPLDAVAHAASDRRGNARGGFHVGAGNGWRERVWCRGRRSASMRRRWKRTRRCGASSGGIPGNHTRRSCVLEPERGLARPASRDRGFRAVHPARASRTATAPRRVLRECPSPSPGERTPEYDPWATRRPELMYSSVFSHILACRTLQLSRLTTQPLYLRFLLSVHTLDQRPHQTFELLPPFLVLHKTVGVLVP